jgi:hypothetical protein
MKRIVLATLVAGCTQNADIGLDDQPVSCMPNNGSAAEAHGTITNPTTRESYAFGDTTVQLAGQPTRVVLSSFVGLDLAASMNINFLCGQPTLDTYGVEGVSQQTIDCPLSVATDLLGQGTAVAFADASDGTLIIDENSNCLAGRFDVKFDHAATTDTTGSRGELAGWFSVPWQ